MGDSGFYPWEKQGGKEEGSLSGPKRPLVEGLDLEVRPEREVILMVLENQEVL